MCFKTRGRAFGGGPRLAFDARALKPIENHALLSLCMISFLFSFLPFFFFFVHRLLPPAGPKLVMPPPSESSSLAITPLSVGSKLAMPLPSAGSELAMAPPSAGSELGPIGRTLGLKPAPQRGVANKALFATPIKRVIWGPAGGTLDPTGGI